AALQHCDQAPQRIDHGRILQGEFQPCHPGFPRARSKCRKCRPGAAAGRLGAAARTIQTVFSADCVAGGLVFPASSVAVTETVSGPSARPETFRPDATQAPEPSVTTVAVTAGLAPSPMLTWIVELGSADPEIPSAGALEESIVGMGSIVGVAGATVSFRPHRAPAAPVLPAASVAVADAVIAPSAKPVTFRPDTVQSPDPSATAEAVTKWSRPASDTSTDTVEFASAVPENETDPACEAVTAGNTATSGATGATVSLLPDAL